MGLLGALPDPPREDVCDLYERIGRKFLQAAEHRRDTLATELADLRESINKLRREVADLRAALSE